MPIKYSSWKNKVAVGMKLGLCLGLVILLLSTTGCRRQTVLEQDYGNAWAYNEAVQIANPQAALAETPAVGLGPQAASNVLEAYNKTFTGAKSGGATQTTINLGGLTTAGGGSGGGN